MSRFSRDEEFFYIDSTNYKQFDSAFFGYFVNERGIFDKTNADISAVRQIQGTGCYILIYKEGDDLVIRQDPNASYGLYLFRAGPFFAVSNSFFYLIDHLDKSFTLTYNRDFGNHLQVVELVSLARSQTLVKEISRLPFDTYIRIKNEKELCVEHIDYQQHSVALESPEAMQILDMWFRKWTYIFRKLSENTDRIQTDLSGGSTAAFPPCFC